MRKLFVLLSGLVLASFMLAACTAQPASESTGKTIKTDKGQYTDISVSELQPCCKIRILPHQRTHPVRRQDQPD